MTLTSVTTEAVVRYSPLPPVKSKPPRAVTAGEKVTVTHPYFFVFQITRTVEHPEFQH